MSRSFAVALALLALPALPMTGACASSQSPPNEATEQSSDFSCPQNPQVLIGTGEPGNLCSSSDDCVPQCCVCPNQTDSFLLSVCDVDSCDVDGDLCSGASADDGALCP